MPLAGIGDERREPLDEAVRPVEAAGPDEPGDEAHVLDQEPCVSLTPIRALIESSFCGSATPGRPTWTGQRRCPPRGASATHDAIAFGSKHSWVVM